MSRNLSAFALKLEVDSGTTFATEREVLIKHRKSYIRQYGGVPKSWGDSPLEPPYKEIKQRLQYKLREKSRQESVEAGRVLFNSMSDDDQDVVSAYFVEEHGPCYDW